MSTNIAQGVDLTGRTINAGNFILDYWWVWLLLLAVALVLWKLARQQRLLATLDERAEAAFADIDAMLAERQALLHNLAATVRSFVKLEKEVLNDVLLARVDAIDALDGAGMVGANTQVATALQNLFTISEQYPTLQSDAHYKTLRQDIIRIEEKLTAARRFYNLAVEEMNAVRRSFPGSLLAPRMGVADRQKFTVGERRAEMSEPVRLEI